MSRERPTEFSLVERPLLEQLRGLGWEVVEGDPEGHRLHGRESYRDVLLTDRLRVAIQRISLQDDGRPWLDETRVNRAVTALERLGGAGGLLETNQAATELLLRGTLVEGDPEQSGSRERGVHFIDWERPERNDFLAVSQFRVDPAWATTARGAVIPDIVLFVNGIPLAVIECKSPNLTEPLNEGIDQLLRYSNQRDWVDEEEGAERLFHYNQLMIATCFDAARSGTLGAGAEHYVEWKDTAPVPEAEVAAVLGVQRLSSQQRLAAGMLSPATLLDLVRNLTLFQVVNGRTVKLVARYQQYRAVLESVSRLTHGKTRRQDGEHDRRGGVVWHTQGSGKSLTMVFLVRKLRTLPGLRRFKIVVVTDRTDLEEQLGNTAALIGETIIKVGSTAALRTTLQSQAPELVFAMLQKYQVRDQEPPGKLLEFPSGRAARRQAAEDEAEFEPDEEFPVLNEAENILVLVDEAHRSHAKALHANLRRALPNAVLVGFTGTPIIIGEQKRTHEIFGAYIDRYTIRQSEEDGVTVPILYMGHTTAAAVAGGGTLDQLFEDMFSERTAQQREAIKARYATTGDVLEAQQLILAKARDMLRVYVEQALPGGFKAQVVAVSRLAAVRYQEALTEAILELIGDLEMLSPGLLALDAEAVERQTERTRFLIGAHPYLETIRRLAAAAVISGGHNEPRDWWRWTDRTNQRDYINRFKKPLHGSGNPDNEDGLAFLCVKSMLLTGFDAPYEQMLFIDRMLRGHELLQAIARVNRTAPGKTHGLVVDYFGVANHLQEALDVYSAGDIEGALTSIADELPILADRHRRVLAIFSEQGIASIHGAASMERCVQLLVDDVPARARFNTLLRDFLTSLGIVLPRPEALTYTRDARQLGFIRNRVGHRSRDESLLTAGAEKKVQRLLDEYIRAEGIDPSVPLTPLTARQFDEELARLASDRARASAMEHAARHHISVHLDEDPVYYRKLSEQLEEILARFAENWEQLVLSLHQEIIDLLRTGRGAETTPEGLDPQREAPFYDILRESCTYTIGDEPVDDERLKEITVALVKQMRAEANTVDFWSSPLRQDDLRRWVIMFLDNHDLVAFEQQPEVADRLVQLARNRQSYLSAP